MTLHRFRISISHQFSHTGSKDRIRAEIHSMVFSSSFQVLDINDWNVTTTVESGEFHFYGTTEYETEILASSPRRALERFFGDYNVPEDVDPTQVHIVQLLEPEAEPKSNLDEIFAELQEPVPAVPDIGDYEL